MSKKSPQKPAPPKAAVPKPKTAASKARSWLQRPSFEDERDPLFKKIFIGASLAILLITIILALGSGINGDDEYQNDYSKKLISYYSTGGADTSALNIPKGNMHYYGGFFDILTGAVNSTLGYEVADAGYHNVRHLFNALFGWLAMLFTALLAKEIAGWRAGILTLLFMFLSPRFLGDSLMNPKDIPFAAGYIVAIYYMALLFKALPVEGLKSLWKPALGVTLGIALAIATRAGGMILIAILGLFAGIDFLLKYGIGGIVSEGKTTGKYALAVLGISGSGYLLALLFWPYALQAPLSHPFEALGEFSKLGVKIRVLFAGENIMSDKTPWDYALQWIWRTIPLFTLFGFIGSLVLLPKLLKKYQVTPVLLALFSAVFPVFYVIYKDSILHDGWRHLEFVYPTMAVMAALFWLSLEEVFSKHKIAAYALYALLGLMAIESTLYIVRNPKFPYTYFNCASGGIGGAFGNYETDYWGVSMRQALDWLDSEGIIKPGMTDTVTIATTFSYVLNTYVSKKYEGKVKVLYQRFNQRYERSWDYGIFPSRYIKGAHLRAGTWPQSRSIHTVNANGVPLLSIEKGGGAMFEGEKALKAQDFQSATNYFLQETQQHPNNELAWTKLCMAYVNLSNFPEARNAAEQLLKVTPDNTTGYFYRGIASLNTGDVAAAQSDFEKAIKLEDDFGSAYYYLALIKSQKGDLSGAMQDLQKCIQVAPKFKAAYELAASVLEKQGDTQRAAQFRAAAGQL